MVRNSEKTKELRYLVWKSQFRISNNIYITEGKIRKPSTVYVKDLCRGMPNTRDLRY